MIYLTISWYVFYYVRFEWGILSEPTSAQPPQLFLPAVIIAVYWVVIFSIFGLYKRLYLISRFDELIRVGKITIIGTLILFFLLFIDALGWTSDNLGQAKSITAIYWLVVFLLVATNRLILRTVQKIRVKKGYGLHNAVIVGTGEIALSVYENLLRQPTLGMHVLGFISAKNEDEKDFKIDPKDHLGKLGDLKKIIQKNDVQDVIVALEQESQEDLVDIIDEVDIPDISIKILPNFYQMISGLNQTNQIFGLPLIEVMPDPMPTWEKFVKRVMDISLSLVILLVTLPILLLLLILIPLNSKGNPIYKQKRVGRYGKLFTMYKFRTMFLNAEATTGPAWAEENDPRITPLGYWLRKLRLDELPQLINVFKGEMSLVGPRPERPYFVDQFKKEIPLYTRRLQVKPGITGWAQVKWKYDSNIEDVKEKTRYDLFYVENVSLRMDFKILINTIMTVVKGKGQ